MRLDPALLERCSHSPAAEIVADAPDDHCARTEMRRPHCDIRGRSARTQANSCIVLWAAAHGDIDQYVADYDQ